MQPSASSGGGPSRTSGVLPVLALLALTLVPYAQVAGFSFLTWDDPGYISHNPHVLAGLTWRTAAWSFTTVEGGNYSPIVWLSHALCQGLFGTHAGLHHLANLGLHLLNTVLLFRLLRTLTLETAPSLFVAAVFAVHPLHVESVAWVSGRKDLLSMLFWLLATQAYIAWVRTRDARRYLALAGFLVLGLLSKAVLVTLPVTLLLLDLWPLRRLGARGGPAGLPALVREKLPLFAIAGVFSVATFLAQRAAGAVSGLESLPLAVRLAQGAVSVVRYLGLTFVPVGLSPFYPHPGRLPAPLALLGALLLLAGVTVACVRQVRARPYLLVGWLWFLVTLLPTLGIIQVGSQLMADRYTYVPMTGVLLAVAWSGQALVRQGRLLRHLVGAAALAALAGLTALGARQASYWKDSPTLFSHALRLDPGNFVAHEQLGHAHRDRGDWAEAAKAYGRAVQLHGGSADRVFHLAEALDHLDRRDQALALYRRTLELDPSYLGGEFRLADLLARMGREEEAILHYQRVVAPRPGRPGTEDQAPRELRLAGHLNLGLLFRARARPEEAAAAFQEAVRLDPEGLQPSLLLALTWSDLGRHDAAVGLLRTLRSRRPDSTAIDPVLRMLLARAGRPPEPRNPPAQAPERP